MDAQITSSYSFHEKAIRAYLNEKQEPLFCLADICKALDFCGTENVTRQIKEEFNIPVLNTGVIQRETGPVSAAFITEPQLYYVMMRSRAKVAHDFRQWVCNEVLPQIRKQGSYSTKPKIENKSKPKSTKSTKKKDTGREVWFTGDMLRGTYYQAEDVKVLEMQLPKDEEIKISNCAAPLGWKWLCVNGIPSLPLIDISDLTDTNFGVVKEQFWALKPHLELGVDYMIFNKEQSAQILMFGDQVVITCKGLPKLVQSLNNYKKRTGEGYLKKGRGQRFDQKAYILNVRIDQYTKGNI